jgi:hypothetical protein
MPMADKLKVFISWSGDLARAVATVWKDLVTELFDGVEPFMSEENIGAGERGLRKIAEELAGTSFGIVVVTQENQHSQWLNYEAGALSKDVNDQTVRVAPSLVDFERKNDVTGPLGQFQGTLLTKEGVERIVVEISTVADVDALSIQKRFARAWDGEFQGRFEKAQSISTHHRSKSRNSDDMLDEILTVVRELARTAPTFQRSGRIIRDEDGTVGQVIRDILSSKIDVENQLISFSMKSGPPSQDGLNAHIMLSPPRLSERDEDQLAGAIMDLDIVSSVTIGYEDPAKF